MYSAIIFDKDGTLFDFNATWGAWARGMIEAEAQGDPARIVALTEVLGYDYDGGRFRPGSIVIAETVGTVAEAITGVIPQDKDALIGRMNAMAAGVAQVEATPLAAFLDDLKRATYAIGVVTNDAEASARRHLDRAGVLPLVDFLAGFDSGHGAKPAPGQLHAFCAATGHDPARCVMVGDSTHDLLAGRAAGMTSVGVLTGPAERHELAPHADAVLPSIAELPGWLAEVRAAV